MKKTDKGLIHLLPFSIFFEVKNAILLTDTDI